MSFKSTERVRMPAYTNFIQDFPQRSLEILTANYERAKAKNRDVTLLISIAFTSLVVPFERLRRQESEHPSADRKNNEKATKIFDGTISAKFLNSKLWPEEGGWEHIQEIDAGIVESSQVDSWAKPGINLPMDKNINFVVSRLRNALSHGSIFTYPNIQEEEIKTLIFSSRQYESQVVDNCKKCGEPIKDRAPNNKYKVIAVSPENLFKFVNSWVNFMLTLKLE